MVYCDMAYISQKYGMYRYHASSFLEYYYICPLWHEIYIGLKDAAGKT